MHFKYCPHCGNKLVKKEIGDEGAIPFCEKCNIPLWDMFTTSIIAAVVNEQNEIALLRQNYVSTVKYVCVAGIMKIGESAEEAVIREIKEEIGLDADEVKFIKSYPYKKKEMLMLGYKANVKKADFKISEEVDSAEWVKFEDALSLLREGSIGWQLVKKIIESHDDKQSETTIIKKNTVGLR
ncbi:MAG: NUDIX domain-containing protein [Lachnospiraceae bacterium]|jgi:NTP pyrophosphohydrolases containing a Zn-finger, probably nucleic-acid-binding|nr:NUDIX domain-containing protein [Lachnospiraceae bacterium]